MKEAKHRREPAANEAPGRARQDRPRGRTPILLTAAVPVELEPLRRAFDAIECAVEPLWLATGVGKTNTAAALAVALKEASPTAVVQVGCAGAFAQSGLEIGDVVVATEEVFADEGVEAAGGFLDLETLGFATVREAAAADAARVYNRVPVSRPSAAAWEVLEALAHERFRLQAGALATVSTGSGTPAQMDRVTARFGEVLAESMEGAAAALVAWKSARPFYEFRGISNHAGERDRAHWDVDTACAHAACVAAAFLQSCFPALEDGT